MHAQHTCTGATVFSHLVRKVQQLQLESSEMEACMNALSGSAAVAGSAAEYSALMKIMSSALKAGAGGAGALRQLSVLAREIKGVLREDYVSKGDVFSLRALSVGQLCLEANRVPSHLRQFSMGAKEEVDLMADVDARSQITKLACALLHAELKRESFRAARALLQTIASLLPMLQVRVYMCVYVLYMCICICTYVFIYIL
jgi:hypothetical protein